MKKFLILEENLEIQGIIQSVISFSFVETHFHFVVSHEEAIAYLEHHEVDIIISALGSRKENGRNLIQDCKDRGILIPIIILTASISVTREEMLEAGAFDLVWKGDIVKQLPTVINDALIAISYFSP